MQKIKNFLSIIGSGLKWLWQCLPHYAFTVDIRAYEGTPYGIYASKTVMAYKNYHAIVVYDDELHELSFDVVSHTCPEPDFVIDGGNLSELYHAFCEFVEDVIANKSGKKIKGYKPLVVDVSSPADAEAAAGELQIQIRQHYGSAHAIPHLLDYARNWAICIEIVCTIWVVQWLIKLFQ